MFHSIWSNEKTPGNLQEFLEVVDLEVKKSMFPTFPWVFPFFRGFFSVMGINLRRPPEQSWSVSLPQEDDELQLADGSMVVRVCWSYNSSLMFIASSEKNGGLVSDMTVIFFGIWWLKVPDFNLTPWLGALGWKHLLQAALCISAGCRSPICRVSKRGRWRVRTEPMVRKISSSVWYCLIWNFSSLFSMRFRLCHDSIGGLGSWKVLEIGTEWTHLGYLGPDFAWEIGDQCGTFLRSRMFSKRCFLLFVFLVYATKLSVIVMILITYPNQPSPNCSA